jgi:hemoglobin-like flavoprotein
MTPAQITLVEETLAAVDLDALTRDFYRRAFASDPSIAAMFTSDPEVQRRRFAAELGEIVRSIRTMDGFTDRTGALGGAHRDLGVRAAHYRLMGEALLAALAAALGDAWTADTAQAWVLAYDLTAEAMMSGGFDRPRA